MKVIMHGGVGDHVDLTAIFREVKRQFPDEIIDVETSRPEIVAGNPHLRWGRGKQRWGTWWPNLNVDLKQGSMPHSFARQLGIQLVDDTPELFLSAAERSAAPPVPDAERTIAVDPWAFWKARRWSYDRYVEVCARLRAEGWKLVELGHRKRADAERGKPLSVDATYFNRLNLRQTAALLERCALFLGNDSGMMHVAAAVGTPQVIVFGSVRWYARAFYTTTPVFAYSECHPKCFLECVRRAERPAGMPPGQLPPRASCIDEVTVDRVVDAVRVAAKRWLPRAGAPRPEARYGPPTILPAPIPERELAFSS